MKFGPNEPLKTIMKTTLLLLLLPFVFWAQQPTVQKESLFVALYTVGENWDTEKSPNEQAFFKEHSAFLKKLRDTKVIVQGARYGDTGMVVFKASGQETAESLIHSDLAIQNRLFNVKIYAFSPFYKGCIE